MGGVLFPSSRLIPERKGNGAGIHSAMINLNNRSYMYLDWVTIIPSEFCSISSPKNCFRSPKSLISKALWRAVLMAEMEATVLPVISKSSKYKTIIIKWPSDCYIYTFGSDLHLWKFCERRKASILEYHSLGACFNPYSYFFNLQTKDGSVMYPSGCFMYISSWISPCRNANLTSIWCTSQCLDAEIAKTRRMESIFATGAKVSW